ncbi:hypothetical protein BD779DRAFT_1439978 [Infundibulicybe gibba]|nr:hypothetical protein BD779DRAFT_1439978 [Infundibulicybe gibba]
MADLTDALPTGANTPTRPSSPTRRETILSLVEMLLQQNESIGRGDNQQPSFEDDRDVPTVDEHLQVVGAEAFNKFQRRINNLDKELRNFANAARQLGSSVAILSSSFHLRERLAKILFLFRENAADLFPRKITRLAREATVVDPQIKGRRKKPTTPRRSTRYQAPQHVATPTVHENLDPESFPSQLEALAVDVTTFLHCLNEFPEFTDEAVNASIDSFEGDLKYWASCLEEYAGQFRYPAVQRYIHDLTSEMGEHIDSITSTLSMFIEIGVPTIRFAQKHGATNLLNLSTVATFFSAVTATTLQFSFDKIETRVENAVNSFWFASLVFSISAAVNSLLGLTWKQAMYRSPGHRVPWWVLIWIKRSPLVFLVMSVACFSIGLCCFAYASGQHHITSTITTVFTAFTSFGLAAVSIWFASERWIFLRHRGKKWLSDVLIESKDKFLDLPGIEKTYDVVHAGHDSIRNSWKFISRKTFETAHKLSSLSSDSSHADNGDALPFHNHPVDLPTPPRRQTADSIPRSPIDVEPKGNPLASMPTSELEGGGDSTPTPPTKGKELWRNAIRSVKLRSAVASPLGMSMFGTPRGEPRRKRTTSSSNLTNGDRKNEPVKGVLRSRVAALVPKLKSLETTQDLAAHQALVRHLQFSPDGRYLATSSWDRTSVIFRVGDPFVSHRILAHAQGFVGQVAWSPTGNLLLTKLGRGIKVWTAEVRNSNNQYRKFNQSHLCPQDGVCKKTIDRRAFVESITWFPGGEAFISVEGSDVTKLDLNGKVLDQYHFGRMKLHDVAVTPDSTRLIGVGPLLASPTGLQPSKSRAEKRLVVYNMDTKQVENQTPVLNDVRDITLTQNSRSGLIALVSYENKAPPQLWKLELVKDRDNNSVLTARLTLRHTYMPKVPVDFAGPSYFGGKNNELVLCAGKGGDIHIWDQESGALLHHVRAQALGGDLTCIAWNHAAEDPFMFATGSHDGAVRIWTEPAEADMEINDDDDISAPFRTDNPNRSDSPMAQQDHESLHTGENQSSEPST